MPSLARPWGRDARRRLPMARCGLEVLEGRALPSGAGAGLFGSSATPSPSHVPTVITLGTVAATAETGQSVPLVATVTPTGTARQSKAASHETIAGTVEFLAESPRPILLGKVALNQSGQSSSSLLSTIASTFGASSQGGGASSNDTAFLETKALTKLGPYQIEARFLPANGDFRASTSARVGVTITPRTQDAPTVSTLQAPSSVETGASVPFTVTVENPDSSLAGGVVKLTTVSPHPVVLGKISVGVFDRPIPFSTDELRAIGSYQVQATYIPSTGRFAGSTSAPVDVAITPMTAVSFRVTPVVSHGDLNQPLSFTVTALDAQGQPLTDYTGTVVFSSPTDSWTILPAPAYKRLGIAEPSPDSPGLATFSPGSYTFTTADRGSHTFVGAVRFGKGGAETLQVTQADDPEVTGEATFAIA
jgi:hypothetical protein